MANVKITETPAATTVASSDVGVLVQGGTTKNAPFSLLPAVNGVANVKSFGAKGDWNPTNSTGTDDSAAFAAAVATGLPVFVPPGNYRVLTAGFDTYRPRIFGNDAEDTIITLGAGVYFYDTTTFADHVYLKNLTFSGGAGALRLRYTGDNVSRLHIIEGCKFLNFTVCAVQNNSNDMPLWKIQRNFVSAANDTSTIGFALTGLTDACNISDNEFFSCGIHIKLGNGGNNAYVKHNDFIQGAAYSGTQRVMLWIVPRASNNGGTVNAGAGGVAWDNKWGNENLGANDKRVLVADEGSGTYFGDKYPNMAADSTGFAIGFRIGGGAVNGGTSNPLVYSTCPNLRGWQIACMMLINGTPPSYILQTRTAASSPDPESSTNVIGPVTSVDGYWPPQPVSNSPAMIAAIVDPNGYFGTNDSAGFVNLITAKTSTLNAGGATLTQVTDHAGGTEAMAWSTSAGSPYIYLQNQPTAGAAITLEFDLKAGTTSPINMIELMFGLDSAYSGGPGNWTRRLFAVPASGWKRYRLRVVAGATGSNILVKFRGPGLATGTGVQVGRIRAYHGDPRDTALPSTIA